MVMGSGGIIRMSRKQKLNTQSSTEAELIVGQSGAGMASFIFAPKDCEILMMMSDASQSNLHIFGALADSIGLSLKYILGKHINIKKSYINNSIIRK